MTKQGPGPAAFLLLAKGHLRKAREKLEQEPPSEASYNARLWAFSATNAVRQALKELDKQKEEPCKP